MKQEKQILNKTVSLLLQKSFPFALYRQPNKDNICIIAQSSPAQVVYDINGLCNSEGFVISKFESARTGENFFIKNELVACNFEQFKSLHEIIETKSPLNLSKSNRILYEMTRNEYLEMAGNVIQMLQNKEMDKVVLSRVVQKEIDSDFDPTDFFIKLSKKYKNAFVYLFNIPGKGMWIGATPETLISYSNKDGATIMSLASTLPANNNINWGEKEIIEQRYVSDYIKLRLSELGINDFQEEPVKTIFAGNLAHLQTIFKIPASQAKHAFGNLVKGLHPTPAVCGLPKSSAFETIEHAEPYNRSFYTGYLGPWKVLGKTNLYVNLRCAEITTGKITLYVGGGLTADSIPEKEWEETELKAKTLLSVL